MPASPSRTHRSTPSPDPYDKSHISVVTSPYFHPSREERQRIAKLVSQCEDHITPNSPAIHLPRRPSTVQDPPYPMLLSDDWDDSDVSMNVVFESGYDYAAYSSSEEGSSAPSLSFTLSTRSTSTRSDDFASPPTSPTFPLALPMPVPLDEVCPIPKPWSVPLGGWIIGLPIPGPLRSELDNQTLLCRGQYKGIIQSIPASPRTLVDFWTSFPSSTVEKGLEFQFLSLADVRDTVWSETKLNELDIGNLVRSRHRDPKRLKRLRHTLCLARVVIGAISRALKYFPVAASRLNASLDFAKLLATRLDQFPARHSLRLLQPYLLPSEPAMPLYDMYVYSTFGESEMDQMDSLLPSLL